MKYLKDGKEAGIVEAAEVDGRGSVVVEAADVKGAGLSTFLKYCSSLDWTDSILFPSKISF